MRLSYMEALPDQILAAVLAQLGLKSLLPTAAVSKAWSAVLSTDELWKVASTVEWGHMSWWKWRHSILGELIGKGQLSNWRAACAMLLGSPSCPTQMELAEAISALQIDRPKCAGALGVPPGWELHLLSLHFALSALPVPQLKLLAKEKYASLRVIADVQAQTEEGKAAIDSLIKTA